MQVSSTEVSGSSLSLAQLQAGLGNWITSGGAETAPGHWLCPVSRCAAPRARCAAVTNVQVGSPLRGLVAGTSSGAVSHTGHPIVSQGKEKCPGPVPAGSHHWLTSRAVRASHHLCSSCSNSWATVTFWAWAFLQSLAREQVPGWRGSGADPLCARVWHRGNTTTWLLMAET